MNAAPEHLPPGRGRVPGPGLSSLAAVVLCGGLSRRMGRAKATLRFGHQTLVERAVEIAQQVARPVVVVSAAGQALPTLAADVELAGDRLAQAGPLAGLAAGLAALHGRAARAVVLGCDQPLLPGELLTWLAAAQPAARLVWPRVEGQPRPLPGVYDVELVAELERLLSQGRRRLLDVAALAAVVEVDLTTRWSPEQLAVWLSNVNTPDDYRRALSAAGLEESP